MRLLILWIGILISMSATAQVTNVESRRVKTDTTGLYGEFDTGFKLVKEVGNVFSSNTSLRIQYKHKDNIYLALGEYNWSGARGKTFTNNAYLHLRYNRNIVKKWMKWEAFTQVQFNEITRINLRLLNGTGPRFKLLDKEFGSMYLGTLYMYEYTKELTHESNIRILHEHRMSSYLSFSIFPVENLSLISTTYYQPKLNYWKDYRLANVTEFRAKVTKRLVLSMVYKFNYDTHPAEDISRVTHSFENKIGITF